MLAAGLANPSFRPFTAWDGDEIVATNLFICGEIGSLNTAATLPTHRNRGARSALIAARAKGPKLDLDTSRLTLPTVETRRRSGRRIPAVTAAPHRRVRGHQPAGPR